MLNFACFLPSVGWLLLGIQKIWCGTKRVVWGIEKDPSGRDLCAEVAKEDKSKIHSKGEPKRQGLCQRWKAYKKRVVFVIVALLLLIGWW